jgi:uncharacterized delta-60 repeat protein
MPRVSILFAAFTWFLFGALSARSQTAGSLDPTFSRSEPNVPSYPRTLVPLPDGKVLFARGGSSGEPAFPSLVRLKPDGTLDPSFLSSLVSGEEVTSLAVQDDGKILITGRFLSQPGQPNRRIARLNADGGIDPGFHTEVEYGVDLVVIQPDGKAFIGGGGLHTVNGQPVRGLARLNTDGSLDLTFQATGLTFNVTSLAVQDDGKLLAAGYKFLGNNQVEHHFARLNSDGSLDETFQANISGSILCVTLQGDGKCIIGGFFQSINGQPQRHCARLLSDGSVDPSFAIQNDSPVASMAVQTDGKILLGAMYQVPGPPYRIPLVRVLPNGTREDSNAFNAAIDLDGDALGLALQADGRILVTGYLVNSNFVRLLNDPGSSSLTNPDATQARWSRNGTAPDVTQVAFDRSVDGGTTWTRLGPGTRANDGAWEITGIDLNGFKGLVRARGRVSAGEFNQSSGLAADASPFDFDTFTVAPKITYPADHTVVKSPITVNFTLPEPALSGSVKLIFQGAQGSTEWTLASSQEVAGPRQFSVNPAAPTDAPQIASGAPIADGNYTLILSYQDAQGHAAKTASAAIEVDTVTQVPTLNQPTGITKHPVAVNFTLPELSLAGSLKLIFAGAVTQEFVLAASQESAGPHAFSFDSANPMATAAIMSGAALPEGTYQLTLSYQDALGNAAVSSAGHQVVIDVTPPILAGNFSPLLIFPGALPDYRSQVSGDGQLSNVTQVPSPGSVMSEGSVQVTVGAEDSAGNRSMITFTVVVRPETPVTTLVLAKGATAPGAGGAGGPPGDAVLVSFGVPAIDDAVPAFAFLGSWSSVTGGKGNGLFTHNACIAKAGDTLPGMGDARLKSFSDPVLHQATIACLATLGGVPKAEASVVLAGPAGVPLTVVARVGDEAPGTGGARWKSFRGLETRDGSFLIHAQLAVGSGSPKVAAGNDEGLWIKHGLSAFTLVLREGMDLENRTIKKLVSLQGGNGSPGQGRGWLRSIDGVPAALALVSFADATRAIVEANVNGEVALISQTGVVGAGGPTIENAAFATLGLPAANGSGQSAFFASLGIGNGISKANAHGIFARRSGQLHEPIVRLGKMALENGAVFAALKDPVISEDESIAFPATLKGDGLRGATAQSLWWQPAGGELGLIAQGGAEPPGVPGGQWKTFTSLALLANRGAIFTATLAPGKGGVTPATANGVWAADFTGTLHLLFRTGDTIDGKELKSFTLLRAVPGSEGVTRSFNDRAQIVWRATFAGNETAIVTTEVP